MALARLQNDEVYRWYWAAPNYAVDPLHPTIAELNSNSTNLPNGLIWNLTCAINVDGSQFDLDDPDVDDSLTFCQSAGTEEVMTRSATIVYSLAQAKERWTPATSTSASDGFNTATLAQSLLTWRGVDGYAILSVGKGPNEAFAAGDRLKIAEVSTDVIIPEIGTGQNVALVQTHAKRTGLNWNWEVPA